VSLLRREANCQANRIPKLSRLVHRFESGRERHLINELKRCRPAAQVLLAVFWHFRPWPLVRAAAPKCQKRDTVASLNV